MGQPVSLLCFFQAQGPVDVSGLRAQLQEVLPRWAVPAHFREMPFAPSESKKMPRRLMIAAEELGSDFESDSDLTDMEKKAGQSGGLFYIQRPKRNWNLAFCSTILLLVLRLFTNVMSNFSPFQLKRIDLSLYSKCGLFQTICQLALV